jgi:hypothetical protein
MPDDPNADSRGVVRIYAMTFDDGRNWELDFELVHRRT